MAALHVHYLHVHYLRIQDRAASISEPGPPAGQHPPETQGPMNHSAGDSGGDAGGRGSADGIPYYFSMEVELLLTGVR